MARSGEGGRGKGRSPRGSGGESRAPTPEGSAIDPGVEIAARRLIHGHLSTEGLDPVTAKAMEMLAAVDLVAAEDHPPHSTTTTTVVDGNSGPRWHDPVFIAVIAGLICLVLLSLGYWRQSDQAASLRQQTVGVKELQEQNHRLLSEIESCTTPKGKCAQRGANAQSQVIDLIVQRVTYAMCKLVHPNESITVVRACVVQVNQQQP